MYINFIRLDLLYNSILPEIFYASYSPAENCVIGRRTTHKDFFEGNPKKVGVWMVYISLPDIFQYQYILHLKIQWFGIQMGGSRIRIQFRSWMMSDNWTSVGTTLFEPCSDTQKLVWKSRFAKCFHALLHHSNDGQV
jgi:hypothetical protein